MPPIKWGGDFKQSNGVGILNIITNKLKFYFELLKVISNTTKYICN
jgi:hypothetical protein